MRIVRYIKLCGEFATSGTGHFGAQVLQPLLMSSLGSPLRVRDGQVDGAPQLRRVRFIRIGCIGTEGNNVELPWQSSTTRAPNCALHGHCESHSRALSRPEQRTSERAAANHGAVAARVPPRAPLAARTRPPCRDRRFSSARTGWRIGKHRVRDHDAGAGEKSGGEWPHQKGALRPSQSCRRRLTEQQLEAFVGMDDGNGVGIVAERQGMEAQRGGAHRAQRGGVGQMRAAE